QELQRQGVHVQTTRISSAEALHAALASHAFELMIAAHGDSGFGALDALATLRRAHADIPTVIVMTDCETGIRALDAGAVDCLGPHDLGRLGLTVHREPRNRAERREAERTQARLAAIVESSVDAIISKTLTAVIGTWNASAERIYGYTA